MDKKTLESYLSTLGQALHEQGTKIKVDVFGSAALMLGFQAWDDCSDVDACWEPEVIFDLAPALAHSGGPEGWFNNAISDIVLSNPSWGMELHYGGLTLRLPDAAFCAAMLFSRLMDELPYSDDSRWPLGKTALQLAKLCHATGWTTDELMQKIERWHKESPKSAIELERVKYYLNTPSFLSEGVTRLKKSGTINKKEPVCLSSPISSTFTP